MLKRKISPNKPESLPVSRLSKEWLVGVANRWGISVPDLLEILCYNMKEEPLFDCLKCKFCGEENLRDKAGLVYEMYGIKEGKCTACGSEDYPFDPFSDLEFVR